MREPRDTEKAERYDREGGPAFSGGELHRDGWTETPVGMSLRDWFAGQALAGLCASNHISEHAGIHTTDAEFVKGITRRADMIADAMIEARKERLP